MSLLVIVMEPGFEDISWFKRWEGKERNNNDKIHCCMLSQIAPSFLGPFLSKGQLVVSEGPTFDHSA